MELWKSYTMSQFSRMWNIHDIQTFCLSDCAPSMVKHEKSRVDFFFLFKMNLPLNRNWPHYYPTSNCTLNHVLLLQPRLPRPPTLNLGYPHLLCIKSHGTELTIPASEIIMDFEVSFEVISRWERLRTSITLKTLSICIMDIHVIFQQMFHGKCPEIIPNLNFGSLKSEINFCPKYFRSLEKRKHWTSMMISELLNLSVVFNPFLTAENSSK